MDALDRVAGWPVAHATVGVAAFGLLSDGGGTGRPHLLGTTGPTDRAFAWASVTKTATALAVLVAVEEGTLHLDEAAGPPGSTVRHLLAHASGLGPDPGPPRARPGAVRIYSNTGYRVLGDLLAQRSGLPFAVYLHEAVLAPLGMVGTVLDPDEAAGPAAAGLHGPLDDLVRLAWEWAVPTTGRRVNPPGGPVRPIPGPGRRPPRVRALRPLRLGPRRGDPRPQGSPTGPGRPTLRPPTATSAGPAPSCGSDPEAGVSCAGLADRAFGPWAARHWPALADDVLHRGGPGPPGGPRLGWAG